MRLFGFLSRVFKSYSGFDKFLTIFGILILLITPLKMYFFPYGMFGFGEATVYTEGIVSQNGFQNLNPLFVEYNEADREVSKLLFSGLLKYDPEKRTIVEDMANISLDESRTTYTVVLMDGLYWSDGEPITIDDVYFTFHDIILDESFPNKVLKANFSGINIEKIDNKSLKFVLDKPNIFFLTNLTVGLLPKHIMEGVDPFNILQHDFNKIPVSSGPYKMMDVVEKFDDGRMQITLERNEYYHGDPVKMDFFRIISFNSMDQLLLNINSLNAVVKVYDKYITDFISMKRFDLLSYELPQYSAIFMNMESAILSDKKVRFALLKSVDKQKMLAGFSDKKPVDTPLMELKQEDWAYQLNLDEANKSLDEAQYTYKKDDTEKTGIRYGKENDALELKLIVRAYEEGTLKYLEINRIVSYLIESWAKIGVDVQVEFLPTGEFEERIMQRDYDLLFVGQSLGYNLDTYSYWHSSQSDPMGQNLSNYKSFAIDALIEDIRVTFDIEKREKKLRELGELIKNDIPAIFLYRPVYYYASDGKVEGISTDGIVFSSDRFYNISQWHFVN